MRKKFRSYKVVAALSGFLLSFWLIVMLGPILFERTSEVIVVVEDSFRGESKPFRLITNSEHPYKTVLSISTDGNVTGNQYQSHLWTSFNAKWSTGVDLPFDPENGSTGLFVRLKRNSVTFFVGKKADAKPLGY